MIEREALAVVVTVAVIEKRHQPSKNAVADVEVGLFAVAFKAPVVVFKVALVAFVQALAGSVKRTLRPNALTQTEKVYAFPAVKLMVWDVL